eukprot:11270034-Alexandrium_andersonii.AAC.1
MSASLVGSEMCIRDRCLSRAGKRPIGGRWVDHNKGDATRPNVRSRYPRTVSYTHLTLPTICSV